jgi:regulator of replication initiation timing
MLTELEERLLSITGHTSDINEALDEFESTKDAVARLYDENQALSMINRRLDLCLSLAQSSIAAMQNDAGMFVTEKTRAKINQFVEQIEKTQNAITQSRLIRDGA